MEKVRGSGLMSGGQQQVSRAGIGKQHERAGDQCEKMVKT